MTSTSHLSLKLYHPSNRISLRAAPVLLLIGAPAALVMGWGYAHAMAAINWLPFTALVACILIVVFGVVWSVLMKGAHSRSPRFNQFTAIGLALLVIWARWITTLVMAGKHQEATAFATSGPVGWVRILADLATWQQEALANPLSPTWLAVGWAAECFLMVALAQTLARGTAQEPYSEATRAWATQQFTSELHWPHGPDAKALLAQLSTEGIAVLLALPRTADLTHASIATQWQTVDLKAFSVASDVDARWLTITLGTHTRNDNGKVTTQRQPVLDGWQLDNDQFKALADQASRAEVQATPAGAPEGRRMDEAEPATPEELLPALAALEDQRFQEAISLARAYCQHSTPAIRADAHRLCALAHSRLDRWQDGYDHYRALFGLESSAFNALQIATTLVMLKRLPEGQSWFDNAKQINGSSPEMPPGRLHTAFLSALEEAGELPAAQPHLDWLAGAYCELRITDDHFLWTRGMPFFGEFLRKSAPILLSYLPEPQVRAWYEEKLHSLDEPGRDALSRHLASLPRS